MLDEVTDELQRAWESGAGSSAERALVLTLLAKCAQLEGDDVRAGQLTDRMRLFGRLDPFVVALGPPQHPARIGKRERSFELVLDRGEEDQVRRLHAEHVAKNAHGARLWKWGATPERRTALLAIADEIRPAVAWARAHDPGHRIVARLSEYRCCLTGLRHFLYG